MSGRSAKIKQLDWFPRVRVGSVLRNKSGTDYRVVRSVSRDRYGNLRFVTLAIRKCSWTTRPTTTIGYSDLIYDGYSLVDGVRVKLERPLDRQLEADMRATKIEDCVLHCHSVRGWP